MQDLKYDILKHPNVDLTTDGKAKPYIHGFDDYSVGDLLLQDIGTSDTKEQKEAEESENSESIDDNEFAVYSSEEIEEFLENESEVI